MRLPASVRDIVSQKSGESAIYLCEDAASALTAYISLGIGGARQQRCALSIDIEEAADSIVKRWMTYELGCAISGLFWETKTDAQAQYRVAYNYTEGS